MKKTTIIFNLILGLSCAVLLAGCGSPDEDPNAGASGEGVRPEGVANTAGQSKDGKSTVELEPPSENKGANFAPAKGKKP
ncbi:hypothetical protein EON83_20535 [bacterium]|nr:MAG: hypothetical protein EON83_20535 [bacterium]